MIADLHVHYPLHLLAREGKPASALAGMRTVRKRKGLSNKARALILRIASRLFSDTTPTSGSRTSVEQMRQGGVGVALSVLYCPFEEIDLTQRYKAPPENHYFDALMEHLSDVEEHVMGECPSRVRIVHNRRELDAAVAAGATALVHCVEGGFHLGRDNPQVSDNVVELAKHGVAYVTVSHLFFRRVATNAPALPFLHTDGVYRLLFPQPKGEGLTERGEALVRALAHNRVMIDISHMSSAAIADTFDLLEEIDPEYEVPVIASHGGYRFGKQEYMLDDDTVRQIQRRDGVIGLIMAQYQMNDGLPRRRTKTFDQSLEVICRHIDKIARVTGGSYRNIALGTDFDGFIKPTMAGLENMSDLRRLERALAANYGRAAKAMCSQNVMRMLYRRWP